MAEGLALATANAILNCYLGGTNITAPTSVYLKLHVGAPGSAGTSNPATETTRKLLTSSAASGGVRSSSADMTWSSVAGSETYTKCSLWDTSGPSGGNFLLSGSVTAAAVTAGDVFTIATGNCSGSFPVAS